MPRPPTQSLRDVVAQLDLVKLAKALTRFDERSATRGRTYAREGHVTRLELDTGGAGFMASVSGTSNYRCSWFARPGWRSACTCPVGDDCKHAYAAACVLLVLESAGAAGPPRHPAPVVPPGLKSITAPKISLRHFDWEENEEEDDDFDDFEEDDYYLEEEEEEDDFPGGFSATPRSRASDRASLIAVDKRRLADRPKSVTALFELLHRAAGYDLRLALIHDIVAMVGVRPSDISTRDLANEEDGDLRCSALAGRLAPHFGSQVPPSVEAWWKLSTTESKLRLRREANLARQIEDWSAGAERHYRNHLRVVVQPKRVARERLVFEPVVLQTSARLRDDPRHPEQLRTLLTQVAREPDVLSPSCCALLEWICAWHATHSWWSDGGFSAVELERLVLALGHTGLVTWQPGAASERFSALGIADGDPVRLSRDAARIEPECAVENGSVRLFLRVHLAGGRCCNLDAVEHIVGASAAEPSYLLAAGSLWRVENGPPAPVVEGFRSLGNLELDPERRVSLLRRLAPAHPLLARTLDRYTVRVPSRAVFLLDSDADENLSIRLLAVPSRAPWSPETATANANAMGDSQNPRDDEAIVFEFSRDGAWRRVDRPSVRAASTSRGNEAWLELPSAMDEAAGRASGEAAGGSDEDGSARPVEFSNFGGAAAEACETTPLAEQPVSKETDDDEAVGPEEAWLIEPVREDIAGAVEWLRTVCAKSTADDVSWTLPLRPPRFDVLREAWETRPATAAFFATRRVHRLLGAGARPMPVLDIRSSGKDWFSIRMDWQVEGQRLTQADVAALMSSNAQFVRLGEGWVRNAEGTARTEMRETLEALADAGIDSSSEDQRLGVWQLAATPPASLDLLEKLGADPEAVAAARALRRKVESFRGLPRIAVPRTFRGELRDYQRDGLDFLCLTSALGSGAVLADDMGLGKTVQTLAWLERLRLSGKSGGPALVVCPASVVHNWMEEATRFAPNMRVAVLRSGTERHALRENADEVDLFVTNYALLRIDAEHWRETRLGALVLDEAQNVKNPDAAVSKVVRSLTARHRLALTGTPLENRVRDVWSIVESVSPGYLGTRKRFEERFERADDDGGEIERRLLSSRLRPLLLRRRKREVATDLPARTEEARRCELTADQRRLYLATLRASRRLVGGLARKGAEGEQARIQILAALTRLRQICCHPGLVDPKLISAGSAKFDLLMEVLEPLLDEGHKVLVFSQFARCIQLLAGELHRRKVRHFILTGSTTKREEVVAAFQGCADPAVFLISLKAGGTGLNLTAASYVVLFDPWWNPAVEAQAIDRTHRIGQVRPVMAYRLVAADTIEEKILELQREKASLANAVVDDASFGHRLAKEDLAALLEE